MSEKASSINDVAKRAGVSAATVSNALTGRKKVSAELARKVEEAVKALDYRADPLASMLRSGDAKIVAVLVPDLDNPFFTSIVSAVEKYVGRDRYEVIVASSHGDEAVERAKLKAILAWRPAGLIIIPCADVFSGRAIVDASGAPYVIADRAIDQPDVDTVGIRNEEAGAAGARHLLDLGHREFLVAASSLRLANIRQRCAGAREAARAAGLPEPAIVELGLTLDETRERLSRWFDINPAPSAIQALTNFTTLSVLTIMAERRLRSPDDVSLIGFEDYAWMSARATPLTVVCQPVREMGRVLWERLSARIHGDRGPALHIALPCELRIRASTAAPAVAALAERRGIPAAGGRINRVARPEV